MRTSLQFSFSFLFYMCLHNFIFLPERGQQLMQKRPGCVVALYNVSELCIIGCELCIVCFELGIGWFELCIVWFELCMVCSEFCIVRFELCMVCCELPIMCKRLRA